MKIKEKVREFEKIPTKVFFEYTKIKNMKYKGARDYHRIKYDPIRYHHITTDPNSKFNRFFFAFCFILPHNRINIYDQIYPIRYEAKINTAKISIKNIKIDLKDSGIKTRATRRLSYFIKSKFF